MLFSKTYSLIWGQIVPLIFNKNSPLTLIGGSAQKSIAWSGSPWDSSQRKSLMPRKNRVSGSTDSVAAVWELGNKRKADSKWCSKIETELKVVFWLLGLLQAMHWNQCFSVSSSAGGRPQRQDIAFTLARHSCTYFRDEKDVAGAKMLENQEIRRKMTLSFLTKQALRNMSPALFLKSVFCPGTSLVNNLDFHWPNQAQL